MSYRLNNNHFPSSTWKCGLLLFAIDTKSLCFISVNFSQKLALTLKNYKGFFEEIRYTIIAYGLEL